MNIILKSLIITNFKGSKDLSPIFNAPINFNLLTEISGKNKGGKSTIMDAFMFVNTGKNSEDKEKFSIKNTVNTALNKFDHSVEEVLDVDGEELRLKRIHREIWSTTRGEAEKTFKGHENAFEINGVGKSAKEFQQKLDSIFPPQLLKLLTNPFYFNGIDKYEVRRDILVKIAGEISDANIFSLVTTKENEKSIQELTKRISSDKYFTDFKKEIATKKKKIRETLDYIPARIDEAERSKPESDDFDFIYIAIENKQKLVAKIDDAISDKVKAHREASLAIINKQNDLSRLKIQLQNLESEEKQKANEAINRINLKISSFERNKKNCQSEITQAEIKIQQLQKKIESIEVERAELRKKWATVNAENITPLDPDATLCPSCKQVLPTDKIDAIKEAYETNWKADKKKRIDAINTQCQQRKDFSEAWSKDVEALINANKAHVVFIDRCDIAINDAKKELEQLSSIFISENRDMLLLREQISQFTIEDAPVIDDAELKTRKSTLQTELQDLQKRFGVKEQIEKCEARIMQLQFEEREQAQAIADLERQEFTIDAFTTAKMNEVEKRVNSMFKLVKFTMFEKQINEGVKEVCTCLINGVPYPDANTAGKIQGGLDIISTLSAHYNIYAPIFIDNRESCAEIPAIASQIINLIHVPNQDLKIA